MSLSGKTVVFTGTLDMTRTMATAAAITAGAKVTKAISGKTDIVVAGAAAGGKLDEAKALGVEVWTEAKFNAACSGKKADSGGGAKAAPKKLALVVAKPSTGGTVAANEWQWYNDESASWTSFADPDSSLLEGRFISSDFNFKVTSELSFNTKHKTPYTFDLLAKKQKNNESGKVRKVRRLVNGVESYARDKPAAAPKKRNRDSDDDDDDDGDDDEDDDDEGGDNDDFWDGDADCDNKVTPSAISKTQQALGGKKLPAAYVKLLQTTQNGGMPAKRYVPVPGKDESKWDVCNIYGIGANESSGIASEQENWTEEWEYPDIGIYFADTDSGGHDMWAMDYRKCGPKGEPTIVHVEQEAEPMEITKVADNFQDFMDMLVEGDDDDY